ncbi:TetR/AcrR family transcriptional regulator [Amycolatopsis sp. lyj-112]|uniref:TetR/AcrR family transcriptional regulator n=1 Tax=Amycolatopsis sp. lyj-112 TaxID=2789288 RepID=UPI00397B557D
MPDDLPLLARKQRRAREKIVEAAFDLFEERSFSEVTVTDIATRAEVGRTTFFRYFGDKQEVVFADEQRMLETLASERHTAAPADLDAALVRLRDLVVLLCQEVTKDAAHYERHEKLLARNSELYDRSVRKLQRFADEMTDILIGDGAGRTIAVLAPQLALACYYTGRRIAGTDPAALIPAVESAFAELASVRKR